MSRIMRKLKRSDCAVLHLGLRRHWWRRNFGCVYLSENGADWYRFRARRGRVALVWNTLCGAIPFYCRLDESGLVLNDHDDSMRGYGRPYGSWRWDYEPRGRLVGEGGYW